MTRLLLMLSLTTSALRAATVAHYKFDGAPLDAPLYQMTDSSGNGHHGRVLGKELFELTSDVPPYPGVSGAALDLRGRLDYAVIPHHVDFAPDGEWTIEFFIKPALFHQEHGGALNIAGPFYDFLNTNLSYSILAKQNTAEPTLFGCAWAFHYQPAEGRVVFTISYGADRGEILVAGKDLRDGQWHHIAVAYSALGGHEIRLFVDGVQTISVNGNHPKSWGAEPIYVGAFARQDAQYMVDDRNFDGFLDEIRFSDTALNPGTFVVDFGPFLFPPVPVEVRPAIELQFQTGAGITYRIDEAGVDGAWTTLGYLLGDGPLKSFFHRRDNRIPAAYRVVVDASEPSAPIQANLFEGVEIRFPTEHGQLFTITACNDLGCQDAEQIFVLGDGAKMTHFERAAHQTRFYRIDRY